MTLAPGVRLGPYEILADLGAGGMGEVYRAMDTNLKRQVAIKVLPESAAADPERLARLQREAELLAALNHPNIAHIHGLEKSDRSVALVMELVEGPTLADRIARGAIAIEEALPIAKQIAEALEAAHEQGIIHRDLKPANIKVRPDGTVKVLDFGLAKAMEPTSASSANAMNSPTISMHATQAGIILGTAAYMSPEQARGKAVDKRTDIWAFGAVLFEMLTGVRAFNAEDISATLAFVITKDPDWSALPATTPAAIRKLLHRCLEKDPKRRLQAVGDARLEIDEVLAGPVAGLSPALPIPAAPRRVRLAVIATGLGAALVATLATSVLMRPAPPPPVTLKRFALLPPPEQSLAMQGADRDIAISPDGHDIVYRADPGLAQLVVRAIDRLDAHPLDDVTNARSPFFSADGQWIGFFDGTGLKRAPVTGGSVITIVKGYLVPRGASWGDDNSIVFATPDTSSGLLRVPAGGGEPTVLTKPDATRGEKDHWRPSHLPGGRGVLFTITPLNAAEPAQVAVLDLRTGQRKTLSRDGTQAEYVETGHLLYVAGGTLYAARFDLERLEVLGDPVPVADDIAMPTPATAANYVVSRSGTLVYVSASGARRPRSLVWVDREGRETPIKAPPRPYAQPRLSPDGMRVALTIRDQENDVWIWDLAKETLTRLTFDPGDDRRPVWTPDGRRIVFASARTGPSNLFMQAADGTGVVQRLTTSTEGVEPSCVAPDGSGVVGTTIAPDTNGDVVWFPRKSAANQSGPAASFAAGLSGAEPLVRTTAIEFNPDLSPDGRYLAYQSNESGRDEIYVRPFPHVADGRWQVSTGGGTRPVWARNGRELFYVDLANALTAVSVQTSGTTFASGNPAKLFETTSTGSLTSPRDYDVAPDGQRFLMIRENVAPDRNRTPAGMIVVLNWIEELKRLVPTR